MAGNHIFRGPSTRQPETISDRTVAGAYKPGILVTDDGAELTVATGSDIEKDLLILGSIDYGGQAVDTAYVSGDHAVAYRPQPGDVFQCAMANDSYADGAPLTVGASGYLEDAASGERVLAFYAGASGTIAAGALQDVRWANSFNLA